MQLHLLPEFDSATLLGDSPHLADAAHSDRPQNQNGNETSDSHRHLNRVRPYDSLQTSLWVFKARLFAHNEGISVTHAATCTESNTVRYDRTRWNVNSRGEEGGDSRTIVHRDIETDSPYTKLIIYSKSVICQHSLSSDYFPLCVGLIIYEFVIRYISPSDHYALIVPRGYPAVIFAHRESPQIIVLAHACIFWKIIAGINSLTAQLVKY